jgi:Rhodopirellula transposase DDE domain
LLDSVDAVVQYASTMTWKGTHPVVALVTSIYHTGVKLTKEAMDAVETQLQRLPSLGKWFVDIAYRAPDLRDG